jgi:hypothetical protein
MQMSTSNNYENKKLNWNGSGAAAEDEEQKMPMQQLEDPDKIAAATMKPRGPAAQEQYSRDLQGSPRNQYPTAEHSQAFGVRSASGAEPGTQAPVAERWVRSARSECLDHLIVFSEANLRRVLSAYVTYYNRCRPHRSLGQAVPCGEAGALPRQACRKIAAEPVLGGLHHIYRAAA